MSQFKLPLMLLAMAPCFHAFFDDSPKLHGQPMAVTPWGTYLGYSFNTTRQGRNVYAFTGIPYALPPIGDLRFRYPVRYGVHREIFNATKSSPECMQWDHLRGRGVVGEEDCLYLNVYTNRVSPPPEYFNTQPTVVFIHAGTWLAGSGASDVFQPDYFLEHDLTVVTINHRLGPLGFLSTEGPEAPGNYGLMDQIMALEWVRNNVRYFGGINESVAVMGSGAGGASVHLLTLTPKTRGIDIYPDDQCLIGKAISNSGTAYSPHTITKNALSQAMVLAHKLSCYNTDHEEMLSCLRLKEAKSIIHQIPYLFEFDEEPLPFTPVIDTWQGDEAVIPDEPFHLIKKSNFLHVPWLTGTNQNDGAFRVQDILKDPALTAQLNTNWDKYGPILLHLKFSCKDPVDIANQIRKKYLGNKKFGDATAKQFVHMMTDRFFLYPTHQAVTEHCEKLFGQHCFRYMFQYSGRKSFLDVLHKESPQEAAASAFGMSNPRFQNTRDVHGWGVSFLDELLYLFPSKKIEYEHQQTTKNDPVSAVSHLFQLFYANFIKGGDPSPQDPNWPEDISPWGAWWEPHVPGHNIYLPVDPEMETKNELYREEYINFWNSLPLYENRDHHIIRDEL